jgi:hypothetical protein
VGHPAQRHIGDQLVACHLLIKPLRSAPNPQPPHAEALWVGMLLFSLGKGCSAYDELSIGNEQWI